MRTAQPVVAAILCMLLPLTSLAAAPDEVEQIVERAIKAQGGEKQVARLRTMRIRVLGQGTFQPGQPAVPFVLEDVWQMPDRYKTTTRVSIGGMEVTRTLVVNGDKGWTAMNGRVQDLPPNAVAEMKEQKYAEDLDRLLELKKPGRTLTPLGEAVVEGRPAGGIKVSANRRRDVKLYFDKETGVPVKREHQVLAGPGRLVLQEVFFRDYKDYDGVKHWSRIAAHHDGNKVLEAEVEKLELLDGVDEKEFAKP